MTAEEIKQQIIQLEASLTGDVFSDCEVMEEIHSLKRMVAAEAAPGPERPDESDYECIGCGS
jgi:hypothetical protein